MRMRHWIAGSLGLLATVVTHGASATVINAAASTNGGSILSTSGTLNGVSTSTLIDEVFRPEGTFWQSGTVWWTGTGPTIVIGFDQDYVLSSLTVQADNNDQYLVSYWDQGASMWADLWYVPFAGGAGMRTRSVTLASTVQTDRIRIRAWIGDNSYSLSEVQAFGTVAVPAPGPLVLALGGLVALAVSRRQRGGAGQAA